VVQQPLGSKGAIGCLRIRQLVKARTSSPYSLTWTCAVNGVDGDKYLRSLLVQPPLAQTAGDYEALLPLSISMFAICHFSVNGVPYHQSSQHICALLHRMCPR
jgi:hypothetical protein